MLRTISWARFIPLLVLLGATAAFLHAHSRPEPLLPRQQLASFPTTLGPWTKIEDVPLSQAVRDMLRGGDLLERLYHRPTDTSFVDLFVAYFPSQRTGDLIHSPKHCLPGAGWVPVQSDLINLAAPNGLTVTANRYVIARGGDRQMVLYWYQAHGRTEASELTARLYLVADAIRTNRTDGALVRIVTPMGDSESIESAQRRAVEFAEHLVPELGSYIPI